MGTCLLHIWLLAIASPHFDSDEVSLALHQALQLSAAPGTCFCVQYFRECRLRDGCLVEGVHTWVMLCHQGFPSTLQLNHMLLSYTTLAWLVAIHIQWLLNKELCMIIR